MQCGRINADSMGEVVFWDKVTTVNEGDNEAVQSPEQTICSAAVTCPVNDLNDVSDTSDECNE